MPDWSCTTEFSRDLIGKVCTRGEPGFEPPALHMPFTLESLVTGADIEASMRTESRESLCIVCLPPLAKIGVVAVVGVATGLDSTVKGSVSSVMTTAGGGCTLGLDIALKAAARLDLALSSPPKTMTEVLTDDEGLPAIIPGALHQTTFEWALCRRLPPGGLLRHLLEALPW